MQFYPAGETIARRLLQMPQTSTEWIITGAEIPDIVAAGFQQSRADATRFVHPESGDIYQLARQQYLDRASGELRYRCDPGVTLEDELATRPLTILAMAGDGDDIIDPFDGREDLDAGVLRHVTPYFVHVPRNLLTTAVWAARLKLWGFRVAHGTFGLMKNLVAAGGLEQLAPAAIGEAVIEAMASPQPSELFRVLHRCGALKTLSPELEAVFLGDGGGHRAHAGGGLPAAMEALDRAAAASGNLSSVVKAFYRSLGECADPVFAAFGLDLLVGGGAGGGG